MRRVIEQAAPAGSPLPYGTAALDFTNRAANPWTRDMGAVSRLEKSTIRATTGAMKRYAIERLGIDQSKVPLTFPTFGNIGPAALPFTLALAVDTLQPGDQVMCLGIGSGLNTAFLELAW